MRHLRIVFTCDRCFATHEADFHGRSCEVCDDVSDAPVPEGWHERQDTSGRELQDVCDSCIVDAKGDRRR